MASTTQAQSQITVITDAKQSINELGRLQLKAADFAKEIKDSKKSFDEFNRSSTALSRMGEGIKRLSTEAAQFKQAMAANKTAAEQFSKSTADLGKVNTELKSLKSQAAELRTAIKGMKEGTEEYARENDKLTAIKTKIESLKTSATALKAQMLESKNAAKDFDKANAGLDKTNATLTKLTAKADDLAAATLRAKAEADKYSAAKEGFKAVNAEIDKEREKLGVLGMTMNQMLKYQKDLNAAINTGAVYGTERYQQLNTKLVEVNGAIQQQKNDQKRLQQETGLTVGSLRALEEQEKRLNAEIKNLGINTKEFAAKARELRTVESQISSAENKLKGFAGSWANMKNSIMNVAGGVIGGNLMLMAAQKLAEFIPNLISSQAKLSDSFADIRKTTNMSADEVKVFNKELSLINTRTSTDELRKIAIAAGQLGIAKKDILSFTQGIDTLVVSLGDEFTGGAEQITKEMGALRNIFVDIKSDNVSEDMLHIGNAINQLGAEGAATGPVMADFASRIGGVGITLGLTSGQVLGLSATMQELNITSERGSTAVTKILQKMAATPAEFAKVAGMAAKDFTSLVDNNIYGALVKVVEGSNKTGASATALAAILKELDVDGAGASEVFAKLGSNTELLAKKVNSATSALKGTDSIMNEFNIKNETFAAKLEKIGKAISKVFVDYGKFIPIVGLINLAVDSIYKMLPATEKQSAAMQRELQSFKGVSAEVLSLNVGNKRRVELINELKEAYPEYLGQINAETASNQELKKALDNINDALVKKIVTQKAGEKLQEQLKIEADLLLDLGQKNIVLRDAMTLMYEQGGRGAFQSVKLLQMQDDMKKKSIDFSQQLLIVETEAADGRIKGISATNPYLQSAKKRLEEAQIAELKYMKAKEQSNALDKERVALLQAMGIKDKVDEVVTDPQPDLEAARKIRDARIALMTDEYEQKRAKLQAAADDEKASFKNVSEEKKRSAADIAEYEKLVDAKLKQDLIKLAHEKDRTLKDLSLSLYNDELQAKKSKLQEQATRDVKDFVGTTQQKADYAMLIDAKLQKDIAAAETEYYEKARNSYEKLQKDKVEAAKKAKKEELEASVASEELLVLLTEKVNGSEKRGKYIMQELENQRNQELANVNLTQEQKQAIEQRYDKAKRAYAVYQDTSSLNARAALLTAQMQKELALHEGSEEEKALITAKYLGQIAQLRLDQSQKVAQEITSYIQAGSEIIGQFQQLYSQKIDNQIADLEATKSEEDKAFDAKKQQIDEVSAKEEAAKNKRVDLAAAERDKKLALYESEYKKKKMTETQYNNLRKQAEKEYNELKDAEDAKTLKAKSDREFLYNQEKQKAEDEYNNKVRELKVSQWRAEQNTKRTQAFMEGAVGVINALAVGDYARAALVTIKTALGVALINSQQMPAFAEGGSTGAPIASGGMITKPYLATVAEKGEEYVIPNWQLQVPAVANIVRMLEVMRVNKSTTLPLNEITGNTTNGTGNVGISGNNSNALLIPLLIKMDSTLDKIQQRLDNPKKVEAYLEFQKFDDDYTFAKETKESANA